MNIKVIVDKDKCTGCRACETNCPVNAISFLADREGFLAPQIDKNICIECGKMWIRDRDKAAIKTVDAWNAYMAEYAQKVRTPLTVTY